MSRIQPDPVSLTTHHLHFRVATTDTIVSSATGFAYRYQDQFFLITNWHNLTGKNPLTGEMLGKGAIPDTASTLFRRKDNPSNCARETLRLYSDNTLLEPLWLEHPVHGRAVDVVALPLDASTADRYALFPINDISFDRGFKAEVADDAFIIGYPFSDPTYLQLPVWKRASLASEPDVNIDQLPKMLVDTATRAGLSGSPVVTQRTGVHGLKNGSFSPDTVIGRIRDFIGVYSGRIGDDELKAQLGIVWKAHVIDEILRRSVHGSN
ncbi:hypothetical protein [Nevskia sp.]|uniref:hypothetical protein n=1 Tax=Nevskia sp. TaxID=1929292 RepID=UPI0025E91DAC|nr:hypothetical protein [Nevskia sp.]